MICAIRFFVCFFVCCVFFTFFWKKWNITKGVSVYDLCYSIFGLFVVCFSFFSASNTNTAGQSDFSVIRYLSSFFNEQIFFTKTMLFQPFHYSCKWSPCGSFVFSRACRKISGWKINRNFIRLEDQSVYFQSTKYSPPMEFALSSESIFADYTTIEQLASVFLSVVKLMLFACPFVFFLFSRFTFILTNWHINSDG